jgi:GT2 family glycosyltransferase
VDARARVIDPAHADTPSVTAPRATIVVLTHDRRDTVLGTVARLLALAPRPPVIVVDNGSHDGTAAALHARHQDVVVVALRTNRGAAARNVGVQLARTPYVALADDDTWWAPGALERAVAVLDAAPDVAIVSGRVLVGPEAREDPTCALMAASPLSTPVGLRGDAAIHAILGFLAGASMVRRAAFLDAGGFEPRLFIGGEEHLLAIDLATRGWSMLYCPDVVVHHHPSPLRDAAARRRLCLRNALWSAWLRRPAGVAVARTVHLLAAHSGDGGALRALWNAAAGVGWVLTHRRVVPSRVEAALRAIERQPAP